MNHKSRLGPLFISFLKISAFTLGGGAVMLPLMEEEFVKKKEWVTPDEMLEIFSLVNSLPGIIAIKCAVMIGYKSAGLSGALLAVFAVILPPVVIILLLAALLLRTGASPFLDAIFLSVRASVMALLLMVLIRMSRSVLKRPGDVFFAVGAFAAFRVFNVHPLLVILGSALLGGLVFGRRFRR